MKHNLNRFFCISQINDLVPNGIQTAYGGFYINRGKLSFVKEDNSSSSTSEDVDKFLAQNRLVNFEIFFVEISL